MLLGKKNSLRLVVVGTWSNTGAQEGVPEEQPTQLQATWDKRIRALASSSILVYLVTGGEEEAVV